MLVGRGKDGKGRMGGEGAPSEVLGSSSFLYELSSLLDESEEGKNENFRGFLLISM